LGVRRPRLGFAGGLPRDDRGLALQFVRRHGSTLLSDQQVSRRPVGDAMKRRGGRGRGAGRERRNEVQNRLAMAVLSRGRPEPRNRQGTNEEGSVEGGKAFGFAGHVRSILYLLCGGHGACYSTGCIVSNTAVPCRHTVTLWQPCPAVFNRGTPAMRRTVRGLSPCGLRQWGHFSVAVAIAVAIAIAIALAQPRPALTPSEARPGITNGGNPSSTGPESVQRRPRKKIRKKKPPPQPLPGLAMKSKLHCQKPRWAGRSIRAYGVRSSTLRTGQHVLHGIEDGWTSAGAITWIRQSTVPYWHRTVPYTPVSEES
jgi:hypothetical protein